jgi:hypothetical protein
MEYAIIALAGILLVALLVFAVRSAQGRRDLAYAATLDGTKSLTGANAVGDELSSLAIQRIFAADDAEFVATFQDADLLHLFRQERKRVALRWIGRKRIQAKAILQEHLKLSRTARDLELAGEMNVLRHYAQLRLFCSLLSYAVFLIGPQRLHTMARRANSAFHGFRNFSETVERRERMNAA